jgi:hypothetical protein
MSVGNVWHYEGYSLSSTARAALDTSETRRVWVRVERQVDIQACEGAFEVSRAETTYRHNPAIDTQVFTDTDYICKGESLILSYGSLDDTVPDTLLALPLSAGKTWHFWGSLTAEAIGQENVSVKAGYFPSAWKVRIRTGLGDEFIWFVDHVGQVKLHVESSFMGDSMVYHDELASYDIK